MSSQNIISRSVELEVSVVKCERHEIDRRRSQCLPHLYSLFNVSIIRSRSQDLTRTLVYARHLSIYLQYGIVRAAELRMRNTLFSEFQLSAPSVSTLMNLQLVLLSLTSLITANFPSLFTPTGFNSPLPHFCKRTYSPSRFCLMQKSSNVFC